MKKNILLIVMVALILVLTGCGSNNPETVTKRFIDSGIKKDKDALYKISYFDEEEIKNSGDEEDIITHYIEDFEFMKNVKYEIKKSKITNNKATVDVKVKSESDSDVIRFYLVKNNDKWEVDIFKTYND